MEDVQQLEERRADDRWTLPRLLMLGAGTLTVALTVIWALAKAFAPPGYH